MIWILYVCDAVIVGTYLLGVLGFVSRGAFDRANAYLGPVLLFGTLSTVGWVPLLVLTITFTIAGWVGVMKEGKYV